MTEIQQLGDGSAICGVCLRPIRRERWEMMGTKGVPESIVVTHYRCFPGDRKQYLKTRRNPNPLPIPYCQEIRDEAKKRGIKMEGDRQEGSQ